MQQEKIMIEYIVTCISSFAEYHKMSQKDAFIYLNKYEAISFLIECYNIEHTLSINDAVEDMTLICRKNGGYI